MQSSTATVAVLRWLDELVPFTRAKLRPAARDAAIEAAVGCARLIARPMRKTIRVFRRPISTPRSLECAMHAYCVPELASGQEADEVLEAS